MLQVNLRMQTSGVLLVFQGTFSTNRLYRACCLLCKTKKTRLATANSSCVSIWGRPVKNFPRF